MKIGLIRYWTFLWFWYKIFGYIFWDLLRLNMET